jgi:hypothetical protein
MTTAWCYLNPHPGESMRINPSALSQALFRFPRFLLLSGLIVTMGACSSLSEEETPFQAAVIEQLVAPEQATVGATVQVQLRVSGCWEFSHVEQIRTEQRIRLQAWSQNRNGTCGVVPNSQDVTLGLRLDRTGLWEIEAGRLKVRIDVQ